MMFPGLCVLRWLDRKVTDWLSAEFPSFEQALVDAEEQREVWEPFDLLDGTPLNTDGYRKWPDAPHLSWGVDGASSQVEPPLHRQCQRCGDRFNIDHVCLRDSAAPGEVCVCGHTAYVHSKDGCHADEHYVMSPCGCTAFTFSAVSVPPDAAESPEGVEQRPPATPPSGLTNEVEIALSERGFERYGDAVHTDYGHDVSVYESSAAKGPHLWLSVEHEGGNSFSPHSARAHLSIEQAVAIRDRLQVGISRAIRQQQ